MTVWCVFENDWEGSFLVGIYAEEEDATAACEALNAGAYMSNYSVDPWEVQ